MKEEKIDTGDGIVIRFVGKPKVWSEQEKSVCRRIFHEAPQLPYPLVVTELADGTSEMLYDIPKEKILEEVSALWPFEHEPKPGEKLWDIHQDDWILTEDLRLLRFEGRNIPVSPNYPKTGGMVVDLMTPEEKANAGVVFAQKGKAQINENAD